MEEKQSIVASAGRPQVDCGLLACTSFTFVMEDLHVVNA
jgi:hypothetical protein